MIKIGKLSRKRKNREIIEVNMTTGPILVNMLKFALPLILTCLLQLVFNAADTVVVGRFAGDESLAAVGSTWSLVNLLTNFFFGLSVGANVMAARFLGAKKGKALRETVHTAMMLSIISGFILMLIFYFFTEPILVMMLTPKEVLPKASLYMKTFSLGLPATMIYNFGSALLRSKGDTKRPLIYLSIAGVLNVFLNILFVTRFHLDVAGVGYSTAITQTLSAVLILRCLIREKDRFRLFIKYMKIYPDRMKEILRIGLPAGIQGMLFAVSNVVIQAGVNSFGSVIVAAGAAAANIEAMVYFVTYGFDQAALSFVSQNIGAGRYDRMKSVVRTAMACTVIGGTVFGILASVFGKYIVMFFTDSPEVLDAAIIRMIIICCGYGLCGAMDTIASVLRGIGYSILPTIIILLGVCGFRVVWVIMVINGILMHTPIAVYASYPISWAITIVIEAILLIHVWKKDIAPHIPAAERMYGNKK